MQRINELSRRWGPSVLIMLCIFILSAQPAAVLPRFGWVDLLVKKGGHFLGYGLLALAYWHGMKWERGRIVTAWLLVVLYAVTDEIHQVFVPGRHASLVDVLLFDGTGAALALWLRSKTLYHAGSTLSGSSRKT